MRLSVSSLYQTAQVKEITMNEVPFTWPTEYFLASLLQIILLTMLIIMIMLIVMIIMINLIMRIIQILRIMSILLITLTLLTTVSTLITLIMLFMHGGWLDGWMVRWDEWGGLHSIGVADHWPRKVWPVLDKTHCCNVPNTNKSRSILRRNNKRTRVN